jgi:excisionase family DNA binding protein
VGAGLEETDIATSAELAKARYRISKNGGGLFDAQHLSAYTDNDVLATCEPKKRTMIEAIYKDFLKLTNDPGAAATLVLAHVLSTKEPEFLDIKQAAARLGISRTKMYELCAAGQVRHKKVGRQIRIEPDDLKQIVETTEARPADPLAAFNDFIKKN